MVICSTWKEEFIGEPGVGKAMVGDRVQVYWQHIHQTQYQQLKFEEHCQTCGKGEFKIFPFFKVYSQNKYWREQYEKYKPTLH